MTYVSVIQDAASTIIKDGAAAGLFAPVRVNVRSGYDLPIHVPRGYNPVINDGSVIRPGPHDPHTIRRDRPDRGYEYVGTTECKQAARDAFMRCYEERGPSGSRIPWRAPQTGLPRGRRVPLTETPASGVIGSAIAATGGYMRLSDFTSPYGQVPLSLRQIPMPLPPVGYSDAPTPVSCLPGTPGCYASPYGGLPIGMRASWGAVQNQGQAQVAAMPAGAGPLPPMPSPYATTAPPTLTPTTTPSGSTALPAEAPGTVHTTSEGGDPSYGSQPIDPETSSPWGYSGGARVNAMVPSPSGSDIGIRVAGAIDEVRARRKVFGGLIVAGFVLGLVLKRRRSVA